MNVKYLSFLTICLSLLSISFSTSYAPPSIELNCNVDKSKFNNFDNSTIYETYFEELDLNYSYFLNSSGNINIHFESNYSYLVDVEEKSHSHNLYFYFENNSYKKMYLQSSLFYSNYPEDKSVELTSLNPILNYFCIENIEINNYLGVDKKSICYKKDAPNSTIYSMGICGGEKFSYPEDPMLRNESFFQRIINFFRNLF